MQISLQRAPPGHHCTNTNVEWTPLQLCSLIICAISTLTLPLRIPFLLTTFLTRSLRFFVSRYIKRPSFCSSPNLQYLFLIMASVSESALASIASQLSLVMGALDKQVGCALCTLFLRLRGSSGVAIAVAIARAPAPALRACRCQWL